MDKIIIKDASFLCNIGVTSKERSKKQKIFIDVKLYLTKKSENLVFLSDNIKDAVNYSEVYDLIKKTVEENEYKLIETMTNAIANKILKNFNINKVTVIVKKPNALANRNVKYVAVEVARKKFQLRSS